MRLILELVENTATRGRMQTALEVWHSPRAAEQIAESIMAAITDTLRTKDHAPAAPAVIHNYPSVLT